MEMISMVVFCSLWYNSRGFLKKFFVLNEEERADFYVCSFVFSYLS